MKTPFFSLSLQMVQNLFSFLFIKFSWHSTYFCRLGFSLSSFTWLTSISSFMHIIYFSICIVWLLNSFDPSIFHNCSTRPNDGETKETNTRFYCVMWWYFSYPQLNMMQNIYKWAKIKILQNKQRYKILKHLQASKTKYCKISRQR